MKDLRRDLDRAVARARAHPESAVDELAAVWDSLARSGRILLLDRKGRRSAASPAARDLPGRANRPRAVVALAIPGSDRESARAERMGQRR